MCSNVSKIADFSGKTLTQDDVAERICELRKLIKADKKLADLRDDDSFLLRFLHQASMRVEEAFKKLEEFYIFITDLKDWVAVDPPVNVKRFLDMKMRFVLPQTDRDGRRIYLCRTEPINPSKISITELVRIDDLWMESILDDPLVQAKGLTLLIDVSGFSWRLFGWVTPSNVRNGVRRIENIITKDIIFHVVKTSGLVNAALKIIMPFLSAKMKEQIKFHFNDLESLHKFISPENLPKEYGGTIDVDFDGLNKKLLNENENLANKLQHYKLICRKY